MTNRIISRAVAPTALAALIVIVIFSSEPAATTQAQDLTTTPTVSSVAITSDAGDQVYAIDDDIQVTATFSVDISVTGNPQIEIDVGGQPRNAVYQSHSGTEIIFAYTVAENDQDTDGVSIDADKLTTAGGTIKNSGGTAATLTHSALDNQSSHQVDGVRPTITSITHNPGGHFDGVTFIKNAVHVTDDIIRVEFHFSEPLSVTGDPQITLDLEGDTRTAEFEIAAGNGCGGLNRDPDLETPCLAHIPHGNREGHVIIFDYTVAKGDQDPDGFAIPANAVSLNGGAIRDEAGNAAILSHAAVEDDPVGIIDAVGPSISAITITSDAGDDDTYGPGHVIVVHVTFTKKLRINANPYTGRIPHLALTIGDHTRPATYRHVHDPKVLGFVYTVRPTDEDANGISIPPNPIALNQTEIRDRPNKATGRGSNPAELTHPGIPDASEHKVSGTSTGPKGDDPQHGGITIKGDPKVGKTISVDTSGLDQQDDSTETSSRRTGAALSVDVALVATVAALHNETQACASYLEPQQQDARHHADETDTMTIAWLTPENDGYKVLQSSDEETYTITDDDVGKSIMAAVQYTDSEGQKQIETTIPTPVITKDTVALPIWSATLNLGSATNFLGYSIFNTVNNKPAPIGTLAPTTFTLIDTTHTVKAFGVLNGTLILSLSPKTTDGFILELGDASFDSDDATNRESPYLYQFRWDDHDLDWSAGNNIAVKMTRSEANTPATGAPTIDGTPQVRATLTADPSPIADANGTDDAVFAYRWFTINNDVETEIPGQSQSTLTITDDQVGKSVRVTVDFTDDASYQESRDSEPTSVIQATTPAAPSQPTVADGPAAGELTVTWQAPDSDGGSPITAYQVQWKPATASWDTSTDVSEASTTATSHTITALTAGAQYSVRVLATNAQGNSSYSNEATGTAAEEAVEEESPAEDTNSAPTGVPTISGTPEVGQTLTADTSDIEDADGLTNVSYEYQWLADGAEINRAAGSSFTLTTSQQGETIQVRVDFKDDDENAESLTSAATDTVAAKPLPLTAAFSNVPASHTGANFTFTLTFSENVKAGFRKIKNQAFSVDGGNIDKAKRVTQGSNVGWTITVNPTGNDTVTLTLPATTDCNAQGAICSDDGRKLSHATSVSISGPQ